MAYIIEKSDGTPLANIADDVQLSNVSSLVLFGRGTLDYGSALNNDLILLLQNFANATAPSYPLPGQVWYDTSGRIGVLKLFDRESNWSALAQIGGFGDTELPSGGTTLAGAQAPSVRISGASGFVISKGDRSTNITLFLSEGLIIGAACAETIPSVSLPAMAPIRGYSFALASRFPNGIRAGFTLAANPGGAAYSGLGGGDGSGLDSLATTVETQNDDLLQILTTLQKTVGDNSALISDLQTIRVTDTSAFAQEIKTLQAKVDGALAGYTQTTTVSADQVSALSQQITSLTAQFHDNQAQVTNQLTAYSDANTSYAEDLTTLRAQVGAAQASVVNLQKSSADANSALAQQIQTLSAGLTTTSPDGQTILNLAAQLQSEQSARVSADQAVAEQVTNLTATVSGNLATVQAAIHDAQTASASADTALSQTIQQLTATVGINSAAITNEQTARTTADTASAQVIQSLRTTYDGNIAQISSTQTAQSSATAALAIKVDSLVSQVGTNSASITANQQTQADALSAQATALSQVRSQVGANASAIATETQARTDAVSGIASQITSLSVKVGNNQAAITQAQTATSTLSDSVAQSITALRSQVDDAHTLIQDEFQARSTSEQSLAQRITDLNAAVGTSQAGYSDQIAAVSTQTTANTTAISDLTATVGSNTSAIETVRQAVSDTNSSLAAQSTTLLATSNRQRVFFQPTPPDGNTDAVWFNTSDGNKPYMWDGQEWLPSPDAGIAAAAALVQQEISARASDNQATANQLTNLTSAINNSISAYQQSNNTSSSNDQATANALTLLTASVGQNTSAIANEASIRSDRDSALGQQISTVGVSANRQRVFFQSYAPTGVADAVWFNIADGNKPYRWNGTAWVPVQDAQIALVAAAVTTEQNARTTQDTALANSISALTATVGANTASITQFNQTSASNNAATASQLSLLTSQVGSNTGSIAAEASTRASQDQILSSQISTVSASASKQRVFFQSMAPVGSIDAVWFNASDGNKPYAWNGSAWVPAQDSGIATVAAAVSTEQTARTTADSAQAQQISGLLSTVAGNTATITSNAQTAATATSAVASQVSALQTTVGQNTLAITNEATLRSNADTNLASQISTVSASATRQRIYVQSATPTGSSDALWLNTGDGNKPYTWNGSAWVVTQDGGIASVAAAVSTEQTARTTSDTALSGRIDTVVSTVAGNTALIQTNAQTAATATSAVATNLSQLQVTVGRNTGAITTEQQARADADTQLLSQITTVSASANKQRVYFQSTAPTGSSDAVWFNTGAGNTPYSWNGTTWVPAADAGIAGVSAAVSSESGTRLSNDAALGVRIDGVISTAANTTASILQEAKTRASADSGLSDLITSLNTQVLGNAAAIIAEQTTRANAVSAEAVARQNLSASISSTLTSPKTWVQGAAPSLSQMFPPGRNYHPNSQPNSDLTTFTFYIPSSVGYSQSLNQLANGYGLFAFSLTGTLTSSQYFDTYARCAIVGGQTYEFSAYLGTTACTGQLFIQFSDANGSVLSTVYSGSVNQGSEYNGGTIQAGVYSQTALGRIWVHGAAPASATVATMILRGAGTGASNPALYANRFYFGVLPVGQISPTDWQQSANDQIWINTSSNNQLNVWSPSTSSWVVKSDQRIDASLSAISAEQTARASADGILTQNYTSVLALSQNNAALISQETTARTSMDSSLSGLITSVSATASAPRVFSQATAPTGGFGLVWYNTANSNIPYVWSGTAWVPQQDQNVVLLSSSIQTEQLARQSQYNSIAGTLQTVQANLGLANSAITTEQNARISGDAVQAYARQSLASTVNQIKQWFQGTPPSYALMFPPGVNAHPNSAGIQNPFGAPPASGGSIWGFTYGASDGGNSGASNYSGNSAKALAGGNTIVLTDGGRTLSSTTYIDLTTTIPSGALLAGSAYEFSAYAASANSNAYAYIVFLDSSGAVLATAVSTATNQGLEWSGTGYVGSNAFSGGNSVGNYGRVWVHGVAPANVDRAYLIVRMSGIGVASASLQVARFYFGQMTATQTLPTDWSPSPIDQTWINSSNNNAQNRYNPFTNLFVPSGDLRIDQNYAAITSEASTRLLADNATTATLQAQATMIGQNQAAIKAEADTRSSSDSAITGTINSTAATTLAGAKAYTDAETNNRVNADLAVSQSVTQLGSTLNGNIASAVANEANARTTADATEAATRNSLISNAASASGAQKTWLQAVAPAVFDMFPAGTNILPDAVPLSTSSFYAGGNTAAGIDIQSGAYQYPGGHTAAFNYSAASTLASGAISDTYYHYDNVLVGGYTYEFSAQLGCHRANATLILQFTGPNGPTATYYSSTPGQGAEYSINSGTLPANVYLANGGDATYGRLQVYGYAPSGSTGATLIFRMTGYGDSSPYLFVTRPYFGRMFANQKYAGNWTPSNANQTWIRTTDNYSTYSWNGQAWTKTADARIDQNIAAVQSEAYTRLSQDGALSTRIDSVVSNFNGNLASYQSQVTAISDAQTSSVSKIDSLTSRVGSNEITLGTQQQSINGLSAKYTLGISANGQFGGLSLTGVVMPNGALNTNLEIDANVKINGQLVVTGTMDHASIVSGQVQKIANNSTVWVDSTYGNDAFGTGIGGYNLPFRTIAACISFVQTNLAVSGGVVIALRTTGQYDCPGLISRMSAPITIQGDVNNQGSYNLASANGGILLQSQTSSLKLVGLTISNLSGNSTTVVANGGRVECDHVTFSSANNQDQQYGSVLQVNPGSTIALATNCIFTHSCSGGSWLFNNGGQFTVGNNSSPNSNLYFQNNPTYGYFMVVGVQGFCSLLTYLVFNGNVNASKYAIQTFGAIATGGRGADFIPGSTGNSYNNGGLLS